MRLFIAIPLTDNTRAELLKLQEKFKSMGVKGHFTSEQNFHVTLAFIGEYKNEQDIIDAISDIRFNKFSVKLGGLGEFHDTFWMGIEKNEELSRLAKHIRKKLADNNIPYDKKNFQGHITLIRKTKFSGKLEELLKELPKYETNVNEIFLMRSDRGKNGMIYTPIFSIEADEL